VRARGGLQRRRTGVGLGLKLESSSRSGMTLAGGSRPPEREEGEAGRGRPALGGGPGEADGPRTWERKGRRKKADRAGLCGGGKEAAGEAVGQAAREEKKREKGKRVRAGPRRKKRGKRMQFKYF
jgi:hypothetical protein